MGTVALINNRVNNVNSYKLVKEDASKEIGLWGNEELEFNEFHTNTFISDKKNIYT